MNDNIRKILEAPFPSELLKQRQGAAGKTFTYVEVQHYIDRLNLAFQGAWSWEVVRRDIVDDQLIVEGRLTAGGVTKTGIGGSAVARRRDDGSALSLADDFKKGEADALKRACRLLGIGGHLYSGDDDVDEPAQSPRPSVIPRRAAPTPAQRPAQSPPGQRLPSQPAPERTRLTNKQLNAIWAIARNQGYSDVHFRSYCVENFGAQPEFLSKTFASQLIDSLSRQSNGHDRQPGQEG